jgi:Flp pilus assembly protein TadD
VGGIEAVHWELGGAPRPRQAIADVDPEEGGDAAVYQGLRVLVVVYDPMRGDALARELRAREAVVALTDAAGRGLETARTLVPEIAIVDAAKVREPSFEILRALRRDPRLRWTSILVALKDEIWAGDSPEPQMRRLAARISPLLDADRTLRERARSESLETRLEVTGPWRLLRALAAAEGTLHVKIQTSQASLELDVGGGLVVGAQGKLADGAPVEGNAALAVFLAAVAGKVTVARRKHPAIANLVTPVELALAGAAKDLPSRPPSSPGFALDLPRTEPTPTTTRRAEPLAAPPRIEEPAPRKSTLVFHPPPPEPAPPAPEAAAPPPVLPVAEPPARARNRSRLVIGAASLGVVFVVVAIAVALAASGPEPAATVGRTAAAPAPASAGSEPATAATGVSAEATADAAPEPESEDVAPGSRMSKRDRAAALLQRAKRLRGSGQTPQAEKLYMQILRFDPRNWRAAEELARIYLARRRGAGAVEWAERAVRQHPGSPSLRVLLGDAYKLAGDNGRAERQWRGALRINPRYRDARQRLGMD